MLLIHQAIIAFQVGFSEEIQAEDKNSCADQSYMGGISELEIGSDLRGEEADGEADAVGKEMNQDDYP